MPPVMYSSAWSPAPSATDGGAGVAHAEPLPHDAAQVDLAGRRAVGDDVAADHVVLGHERRRLGADGPRARRRTGPCRRSRSRRRSAAASCPRGTNAPNDCPAEPVKVMSIVPGGQAVGAVAAGDQRAEHRADRAVHVAHRQFQPHRRAVEQRALAQLDQRVVERGVEPVVLLAGAGAAPAPYGLAGVASIGVRSSPSAFQCSIALAVSSTLDVPDRLVQRAESELGEDLADLLGDVLEERLDELRAGR